MSARYSFQLQSGDSRLSLPRKLVLHHLLEESPDIVLLKILGFLLLFRERLQVEPRLHDIDIRLVPHLLQLDFTDRPALWAECGECELKRLQKIAVKATEAEIWLLRESPEAAEATRDQLRKHKLRQNRYDIVGFDAGFFAELRERLQPRNEIFWLPAEFDPPRLQLDFNGIWSEGPFTHLKF